MILGQYTQDDICGLIARLQWYGVKESLEHATEDEAIQYWLVMGGDDTLHDFGNIYHLMTELFDTFGVKLAEPARQLMNVPFHGGGTAYGEYYLEQDKRRVQWFCAQVLGELDRRGLLTPEQHQARIDYADYNFTRERAERNRQAKEA